jgi:Na+-transporting methylmalonyl-CoA/oxaloacetate decarboxylase gamma subunit
MGEWRWRIALALVGLTVILCSLCLLAASYAQIRRVEEREVVPIEVPSSSRSLQLGVM